MLDAKGDRLDYGDQLAPPEGFELDHAIGTTYSLDLEAMLLVPVALLYAEKLDMNTREVREDMLEALVNSSQKITIYCQQGMIKVPNEYSRLMAYLEKRICPVGLPSFNQSFHPKIWVIRFREVNGKAIRYRIINTSRNLTRSRAWDLAITTDGLVDKAVTGRNVSILDFLHYLNGFGKIPTVFLKELESVVFDVPIGFQSIHFHPIGISGKGGLHYTNPITSDRYKKDFRLIMSPFVDNETLSHLCSNSKETILFSSKNELSKLDPDVLGKTDRIYMFNPFIEEAEHSANLSEKGFESIDQPLHAKFYIHQRGGQRSWFIGSANATSPAHERNIEFLIELRDGKYRYRPEEVEEELISKGKEGVKLFEPFDGTTYEEQEEDNKWRYSRRRLIYELSSLRITCDVSTDTSGTYDLSIAIPPVDFIVPDKTEIRVRPLPEKNMNALTLFFTSEQILKEFGGYDEMDLSPFLVVEIWHDDVLDKQFIVNMDMDLSTFPNRLNNIFSSIISNRSRFLSYLSFLLSESMPNVHEPEIFETERKGANSNSGDMLFEGIPIYEKLLISASRYPNKLTQIAKLIDRMRGEIGPDGQPVVSSNFEEMS